MSNHAYLAQNHNKEKVMSKELGNRTIKTPEQLVINDVIPAWGTDLIVDHVLPKMTDGNRLLSRVTFQNGDFADYSPGETIAIIIQPHNLDEG